MPGTVPQQLTVRSPQGNNNPTPLPHHTSLFNLKSGIPPANQIVKVNGIRMYNLPAALVYSSPGIYTSHAIDARTALAWRDTSFSSFIGHLVRERLQDKIEAKLPKPQ